MWEGGADLPCASIATDTAPSQHKQSRKGLRVTFDF